MATRTGFSTALLQLAVYYAYGHAYKLEPIEPTGESMGSLSVASGSGDGADDSGSGVAADSTAAASESGGHEADARRSAEVRNQAGGGSESSQDVLGELASVLEDLGAQQPELKAQKIGALAAAGHLRVQQDSKARLSVVKYEQARKHLLKQLDFQSAKGVSLWPPTSQTIMLRMGGKWAAAMTECGLDAASDGSWATGNARFSEADRIRALRAYQDYCAAQYVKPSYTGYSRWAVGKDNTPSGPSVRQYFGTWRKALEAAN